MTNSLDVVRRGAQLPRIEHVPLFHTTAADDAIDLAAVAGLDLDPWQQHVLRGSLGERVDGRWSAFRTAIVVPRQNGKNALLEARELAGLLLFGERVIIHTAHEFKTTFNSMTALMERIKNSELLEYVRGGSGVSSAEDIRNIDGFKTGNQPSITMTNGHVIQFAARSSGSGRGFTGDLVVLDEAYALKSAEIAALVPTLAAKSLEGNPQVWFTSSAGMPDSDLLASLREQGMSGSSPRLAYYEWSAEDDADPLNVDSWYQSNPGLGYRITEEYVQDEYDTFKDLPDGLEKFNRERLGIWARLGGESVFNASDWAACGDPESQPGPRIVFTVEIDGNREGATIMAVSIRDDEFLHVEVIDSRVGTSWLGHRLKQLQDAHHPEGIWAIAGGHVESMVNDWRREGVKVRLMRFNDYIKACGVFFTVVTEHRLRHLEDPILTAPVQGVAQTWTRDRAAFYWSRKDSTVDITPLVGATVGVSVLLRSRRASGEKRKAVIL